MALFLIDYVYDTTRPDELDAVRPQHRALLSSLHDAGVIVASGPCVGRQPGALLILRADSAAEALAAVDQDPFHVHHLIASRTVREWNPVVGQV